jgi:hypothetical protein
VGARRGNLISLYIADCCWHRFDLDRIEPAALELAAKETGALVNGQEVET